MSDRTTPGGDPNKTTGNDERSDLEEEVIAADDTGMVSNQAELTRIEIEEGLG
jgi:hypothetical protein